jgi:hypothetical protein
MNPLIIREFDMVDYYTEIEFSEGVMTIAKSFNSDLFSKKELQTIGYMLPKYQLYTNLMESNAYNYYQMAVFTYEKESGGSYVKHDIVIHKLSDDWYVVNNWISFPFNLSTQYRWKTADHYKCDGRDGLLECINLITTLV